MPIYEYACTKCGHHLEVLQKLSDKPLVRCPECKGKLEKQFSQTSFQLKGTGWYVTDYSKSGADKKDKKSEPKTDDKAEKTETKTETKAEPKAEPKTEKKADKKPEPAAA